MNTQLFEGVGQYLSASDIMKSLRISRSGLFDMVKRGVFPAGVKVGRLRRWALSDVLWWLECHKKEAVHD